MSEEREIPKGWIETTLGEVCIKATIVQRKTVDPEAELLYLDIGAIDNSINKIISHKTYLWKDAPSRAQQIVFQNDILFSTVRTYLRNIAQVETSFYNGQIASSGFTIIRGNPLATNPKFLFYLSLSHTFLQPLNELQTGTSYPAVRDSDVFSQTLPLPPLPEQHRIVAKIEELFSSLDKGIESLKTAQEQLKVYRQAVLKWAFEGRLTNNRLNCDSCDSYDSHDQQDAKTDSLEHRDHHKNHSNHKNHSSDNGELPEGWAWKKSGELFSFVTSGSRGWAKYYSISGAIFVRITNLNFDTLEMDLSPEKIQYVNPPVNSEGIRTKVQEGDFLFSITGYLGMFAIAQKLENAFVNQHIALCRPKSDFNKKFVGYWIISKSGGYHYLNKLQKGATKAGLGLDDIKSFPVPIAPQNEQEKIVQEIESRLSVCDKIEESISTALQQAEALRQSILKKAFEGKLVPQDPNDEPAGVLLERIRAERELLRQNQGKYKTVKPTKKSSRSIQP